MCERLRAEVFSQIFFSKVFFPEAGIGLDAGARLRVVTAGTAQHPCLCQPRSSVAAGSFPLLRERRFAGSRAAMEEENATGWLMQLVYFLVLLADGVR